MNTKFAAENAVIRAFRAIGTRLEHARASRARRLALVALLDMDFHRLDDMGISVETVRDAFEARMSAPAAARPVAAPKRHRASPALAGV